jgi:hypothetical protein
MNKLILGLVLLGVSGIVRAQSFDDWFEQNKTRLKDNEQQIAALKIYIGYAEKGYKIVESGLSMIRGIKSGEFNLHNSFYSSLEAINPAIGHMGELLEIMALQVAIVERFSSALSRYRQNASLGANEVDYIGKVYSLVLSDGLSDINALLDIITANKLQLSDDQRMERIEDLDAAMKKRYSFTAGFTNQADLLCLQRQAAGTETGTVKGMYGLP